MTSNVGYNASSENLTPAEIVAAGAVSGFVTRMLAQPLDVLKIRFQLQVEPTRRGCGGRYHGLIQAGVRIINEEGWRTLWRGHIAAQALTILYGAGQFWSYNAATRIFLQRNQDVNQTTIQDSTSNKLSMDGISSCNNNDVTSGSSNSGLTLDTCNSKQVRISQITQVENDIIQVVKPEISSLAANSFNFSDVPSRLPDITAVLVTSKDSDATCEAASQAVTSSTTKGLTSSTTSNDLYFRSSSVISSNFIASASSPSPTTGLSAVSSGTPSTGSTCVGDSISSSNSSPTVTSGTAVNHELSPAVLSVCGATSAVFGTLASMPFDVARTRIVAQSVQKYHGLWDVFRQMVRQEGPRSLWRGLGPTLASSAPFSALQFPVYTLSMAATQHWDQSEFGLLWRSTVCGVAAGVFAKLVVYPLDVLKKRSQLRGAEQLRQHFGKVVVYRDTLDIVVRVTREEGLTAWYKGLSPSLAKSAVVSALAFVSFEGACAVMLRWRRPVELMNDEQ